MSQVEIERPDHAIQQMHKDLLEAASVAETGKKLEAIEATHRASSRERIGRQMLKPKKKFNNYLNSAASAQELRIAEQKRNRALYGDALEDVDFLRRCGWAINLSGDGQVQFGNQLLTLGGLREKAERERRLRQPIRSPFGQAVVRA